MNLIKKYIFFAVILILNNRLFAMGGYGSQYDAGSSSVPDIPVCTACPVLAQGAKENNTNKVRQALELGFKDPLFDIDGMDESGLNALMRAAQYGNLDMAKLLAKGLQKPIWQFIPNINLINIASGSDGSVWAISSEPNTKYPGFGNNIFNFVKPKIFGGISFWVKVDGALTQISVGNNQNVWGLNSKLAVYKRENNNWKLLSHDNEFFNISVGSDGTVWGLLPIDWKQDPKAGKEIARITGINSAGTLTYEKIEGALIQISVGDANNIWGVNNYGHVFKRAGDGWQEIPAPENGAKYVSVASDGSVWAIGNSITESQKDKGYNIYKFDNNNWLRIDGALKQITVGNINEVYGIDNKGLVYKWTGIKNIPSADLDYKERTSLKRTPLLLAINSLNPAIEQQINLDSSCEKNCQASVAVYLIRQGADVNIQDTYGSTPLHMAILYNQPNLVKELISSGAKLDQKNKDGETPLHLAVRSGNLQTLILLLKLIKDNRFSSKDLSIKEAANLANNAGQTPLSISADEAKRFPTNSNYTQRLNILNSEISQEDKEQAEQKVETEITKAQENLINAVKSNQDNIAESILNSPITNNLMFNIDLREPKTGMSPIHYAANFGNLDLVKLLFTKNSNIDGYVNNTNKYTPLIIAIIQAGKNPQVAIDLNKSCKQNCFAAVAIFLLEKAFANPNNKDAAGLSPLAWAINYQQKNIINSLLNQGASFKTQDNAGNNPLHNLFNTKNIEFIKWFLNTVNNSGVNISKILYMPNSQKITPLTLAKNLNNQEILKIISQIIDI